MIAENNENNREYLAAQRNIKVVKQSKLGGDSTDLLLLVSAPTEGIVAQWDKERITKALMEETGLPQGEAFEIATAVEKKIFNAGISTISTSLIRELTDNELFIRGYNKRLEKQGIIGMPIYNLNQLILSMSKENANVQVNNPEMINLSIAENTLKQYALREIFSKDVSEAHMNGSIHLHDLGFPIRTYCSAHSIEFIKKFGLHLENLSTTSVPAKHGMTLVGHLNTFLASIQAYYAGALGLSYVNILFAPYLEDASYQEMKQLAQYLIFSCSQNAFSRGGQTLFIDFNVHLGVPNYMRDVKAIGPKGEYTGKTYGDYEETSQKFLRAMLDVWREGDANGAPFPFPKCDLHVEEKSFTDPKQKELLEYACEITSENGSPYFVFDRDEISLSMCCRLRTEIDDDYVIKHPESMRFCGFQNVTINLPQASYIGKDVDGTIKRIYEMMELAMKAHLQKKRFIASIMDGPGKPLWQMGKMQPDGRPYINLDEATYIIGVLGLNEVVKHLTGKALHESDESYKTGLKIISAMYLKAKEFKEKYGLKVTLEETPGESTSLRFAKVDLMKYPESKKYVRGNQSTGEVYYTNSIHLEADAPSDIFERIEKQGKFHTLIESGAITHVFLGEQRPDPKSIYTMVKKTFENTPTSQLVFSPEFTVCKDCHTVSPGYKQENALEVFEEGGE